MKHIISGIIFLLIACGLMWLAISTRSGTFVYITSGLGILLGLFWIYAAWFEYKNN